MLGCLNSELNGEHPVKTNMRNAMMLDQIPQEGAQLQILPAIAVAMFKTRYGRK